MKFEIGSIVKRHAKERKLYIVFKYELGRALVLPIDCDMGRQIVAHCLTHDRMKSRPKCSAEVYDHCDNWRSKTVMQAVIVSHIDDLRNFVLGNTPAEVKVEDDYTNIFQGRN